MEINVTIKIPDEQLEDFKTKLVPILETVIKTSLPNPDTKEFYTPEDVRKMFNIKNVETIYRHIQKGLLIANKIGKSYTISRENLRKYEKSRN